MPICRQVLIKMLQLVPARRLKLDSQCALVAQGENRRDGWLERGQLRQPALRVMLAAQLERSRC
jgi:hypothetical protein